MTVKETKEMAGSKYERFLEAEKNYRRLAEKIAPFVERRRFEEYSTAGRWRAGSALHAQELIATRASATQNRVWHGEGVRLTNRRVRSVRGSR